MVKKILAVLSALLLCTVSLPVQAATTSFPLNRQNSWKLSYGGGTSSLPYPTLQTMS